MMPRVAVVAGAARTPHTGRVSHPTPLTRRRGVRGAEIRLVALPSAPSAAPCEVFLRQAWVMKAAASHRTPKGRHAGLPLRVRYSPKKRHSGAGLNPSVLC